MKYFLLSVLLFMAAARTEAAWLASSQNVASVAMIPSGAQSGTALDWGPATHEKRLFRAVTTDTTFTFANLPTSSTNSVTLVLYLTNNGPAGVASITFPATVQWPFTVAAPNVTQLSNSVTRFEFEHMGGGKVFGYDRQRDVTLLAGNGVTLTSSGPTTTVSLASSGGPYIPSDSGAGSNIVIRSKIGGGAALTVNTNTFVVTNGNVGIAKAAPTVPLDVVGAARITGVLEVQNNIAAFGIVNEYSSGTAISFANSAGNEVGIGTATPTNKLQVVGAIMATAGFASYSSNLQAVTQVTLGASPSLWTNTSSRNVSFGWRGAAVTGVSINSSEWMTALTGGMGVLQPGEYVGFTNSIIPTFSWKPF